MSSEICGDSNMPPFVLAGADQLITLPADSVMLDGSASHDPDGTIEHWVWTKIAGPSSFSLITITTSAKTAVKNLEAGVYQFELKVTDNCGHTAKDIVQVSVVDPTQPNHAPNANAGPDQNVILPVEYILLDGSASSDPDYNITAFWWSMISGPTYFSFDTINGSRVQVYDLVAGVYRFELKIIDLGGLSSRDTVQITVVTQNSRCDNSIRPEINAQLIPSGTLSVARLGLAVASAGNKILFAGASLSAVSSSSIPDYGSSRVDIYDMSTQTWSTAELSKKRSDIAAVAAGNKIFFAGGRLGDGAFDELFSTVDIFDASTNTWSAASLSEPRAYIAATVAGNKVFFAGGERDWNYNTSRVVDVYDLSANTWTVLTLSEARAYVSAVTIDNKVYFAGGHREDRWYTSPSNRIDIYDNTTGSWSASSLSQPMGSPAGIAAAGKIYWAEGCSVEIKNANTWNSSFATLFAPGGWLIVQGQNAVLKDNKIIFFRHDYYTGSDKFDIYDITTNTWSIGVLTQKIYGASIVSVNNTIYLAGGTISGSLTGLSNQVWKLEF